MKFQYFFSETILSKVTVVWNKLFFEQCVATFLAVFLEKFAFIKNMLALLNTTVLIKCNQLSKFLMMLFKAAWRDKKDRWWYLAFLKSLFDANKFRICGRIIRWVKWYYGIVCFMVWQVGINQKSQCKQTDREFETTSRHLFISTLHIRTWMSRKDKVADSGL